MSLTAYLILLTLLTGGVTVLLRAFPFLAFGHGGKPPAVIRYLGSVISPAVIAMLIVYCCCSCFKGKTFTAAGWGIPEFSAGLTVILLHLKFRNPLLSIIAGTALYMFLVQKCF